MSRQQGERFDEESRKRSEFKVPCEIGIVDEFQQYLTALPPGCPPNNSFEV